MDQNKLEYEFLDLSDVNEEERSNLKCTLLISDFHCDRLTPSSLSPTYSSESCTNCTQLNLCWTDPNYDLTSSSSGTPGPPTATSSLDSLSTGEGEMPPHSPVRPGGAQSQQPPTTQAPPPPQAYTAPPPPLYSTTPGQPWSVMPSNVYVSQVTANVNVHGYMGQYYQPQQQQTYQQNDRRRRKLKRGPSPPPPAPPPPQQHHHYLPYSPYFPQHGAPLYHVPVYPQVGYVGYPYAPYMEYPVADEPGTSDKGPEEYPTEMMIEHEPQMEGYYPTPQYIPHGVYEQQNRHVADAGACSIEYPMYVPPPHHIPPPQHHLPHHAYHPQPMHANTGHHQYVPAPHQFNVHAKNFVRQSDHNKTTHSPVTTENKQQETHPQHHVTTVPNNTTVVETLPIKDLKINPPKNNAANPVTIKQVRDKTPPPTQSPPMTPPAQVTTDNVVPKQPSESPKPAWTATNSKPNDAPVPKSASPIPAQVNISVNQKPSVSGPVPIINRTPKSAAPFTNNKQILKGPIHPVSATIPQVGAPSKAPFPNKQKNNSNIKPDVNVTPDVVTEKPIPESCVAFKNVVPVIAVQSPLPQVAGKAPFSHGRKVAPVTTTEPTVAPMPAPSAADFPPPPTPRARPDASNQPITSPTAAAVQLSPAQPSKTWASLFNKSSAIVQDDDNSVHISPALPTAAPVNPSPKPVAKVGPYDASPLQHPDKIPHSPLQMTSISYSEKTSANSHSHFPSQVSSGKVTQSAIEANESTILKEIKPLPPPPSSLFADDPNSYRMGEFLSKYQLDSKNVCLQPRGLTNQSNFCYVNAILQALIACPPFYNMLKSLPYQTRRGKSSTPIIDAMVELCYEFSALPGSLPSSSTTKSRTNSAGSLPLAMGIPLEGACAQRVLRAVRPSLADGAEGRQEDAEEFLSCLLNGINDEMLELIKLVEPEEPRDYTAVNGTIVQEDVEDEDDDDWKKVMGPKNRGAVERRWGGDGARSTPLSRIFRGRRRTRLQRTTPPLNTDTVEPFFTLQLEIEKSNSVKEALDLIGGKDAIEGGCVEGGANSAAVTMHQVSLDELPVVLLLHLKCFQLDPAAPTRPVKIVKPIDFPVELTIDTKIMSSKTKYQQKQRVYKLFAVVYHEGTEATKGHYVTDTAHPSGGWVRYDDSTVTQVTEQQVLKPKPPRMPYLVMYRRKETGPTHRMQGKAD